MPIGPLNYGIHALEVLFHILSSASPVEAVVLRKATGAVVKCNLVSHQRWVSGVAWHPQAAHLLASVSHDNTAKLWDTRSLTPLHTLEQVHHSKALCLAWVGQDYNAMLITGGDDRNAVAHRFHVPESGQ